MPLFFNNKFQLPKHSTRRKLSFHSEGNIKFSDDSSVVLRLGGKTTKFANGEWIPIPGQPDDISKEYEILEEKAQQLQEENNLLKLKIEVLLDMLTEETMKLQDCTTPPNYQKYDDMLL